MRNTLIIGLLLCLPVAVLLLSAPGRNTGISVRRPILVGQVAAVFAQAGASG
jgi:hypothetical protein